MLLQDTIIEFDSAFNSIFQILIYMNFFSNKLAEVECLVLTSLFLDMFSFKYSENIAQNIESMKIEDDNNESLNRKLLDWIKISSLIFLFANLFSLLGKYLLSVTSSISNCF